LRRYRRFYVAVGGYLHGVSHFVFKDLFVHYLISVGVEKPGLRRAVAVWSVGVDFDWAVVLARPFQWVVEEVRAEACSSSAGSAAGPEDPRCPCWLWVEEALSVAAELMIGVAGWWRRLVLGLVLRWIWLAVPTVACWGYFLGGRELWEVLDEQVRRARSAYRCLDLQVRCPGRRSAVTSAAD